MFLRPTAGPAAMAEVPALVERCAVLRVASYMLANRWFEVAAAPRRPHPAVRDIKIDVRLPDVIALLPPATLLEALNTPRAALKCADARAPVAARPARVLD